MAAIIALCAIGLPASGQPAKPTHRHPSPPPASTPPSGEASASKTTFSHPGQGRLIREGSHLVQVRGTLHADEAGGSWRFVIDQDHPTLAGYELLVLPCTNLGEMQRVVEVTETQKVVFEVSGQAFAYRGRNYLLPAHAALVAAHAPGASQPADGSGDTRDAAGSQTGNEPDAAAESDEDDAAAAISANLERAVGPMKQSLDTGPAAKAVESTKAKPKPVKEDAMMLSRRGRMTRDAGGSWTFVFDADAAGLADPPMTLLPCLLLERMESYAGSNDTGALMLVSGRVLTYHEHNYLLPSVYQIPRERTPIKP